MLTFNASIVAHWTGLSYIQRWMYDNWSISDFRYDIYIYCCRCNLRLCTRTARCADARLQYSIFYSKHAIAGYKRRLRSVKLKVWCQVNQSLKTVSRNRQIMNVEQSIRRQTFPVGADRWSPTAQYSCWRSYSAVPDSLWTRSDARR